MLDQVPDLLIGTEMCLVAEVPGAGGRWQQVHFNKDIARQFFNLSLGDDRSITLEKISATGRVVERTSRRLVFSEHTNKNSKIEFAFGSGVAYPMGSERPLLVVVEAAYLTYRYRTVMPGVAGYPGLQNLLAGGPSIGKGVRRRIVTLDELESYWPEAALRGGV